MVDLIKKNNSLILAEGMRLIVDGIRLVADGCDDEVICHNLNIDINMVPRFRQFLIELGFVSTLPKLNIGYDELLDIGKETKEVYIILKHMLLSLLHNADGISTEKEKKNHTDELYRTLEQIQRYQAFMLKSQERYNSVKIFRKFQEIILDEVGKFDENAKFEILNKMKELIGRKF